MSGLSPDPQGGGERQAGLVYSVQGLPGSGRGVRRARFSGLTGTVAGFCPVPDRAVAAGSGFFSGRGGASAFRIPAGGSGLFAGGDGRVPFGWPVPVAGVWADPAFCRSDGRAGDRFATGLCPV